jgi:hypothetical protein
MNLTEFIQPETFAFCKQLAQASDNLKSRLLGGTVRDFYQFPLLGLMLNTLSEDGMIRARQATGTKSLFESVTDCSCSTCAPLLQQCVILRALRSIELKQECVHWKLLLQSVFRAGYVFPYAALLLFIDSAATAATSTLESSEKW